jgi:hypothetical protein
MDTVSDARVLLRADIPDPTIPQPLDHFEAARELLKNPALRAALLAEYAMLCQRKAETPLAQVSAELLQQIAHTDGARDLILRFLRGEFFAEDEIRAANSYISASEQE